MVDALKPPSILGYRKYPQFGCIMAYVKRKAGLKASLHTATNDNYKSSSTFFFKTLDLLSFLSIFAPKVVTVTSLFRTLNSFSHVSIF